MSRRAYDEMGMILRSVKTMELTTVTQPATEAYRLIEAGKCAAAYPLVQRLGRWLVKFGERHNHDDDFVGVATQGMLARTRDVFAELRVCRDQGCPDGGVNAHQEDDEPFDDPFGEAVLMGISDRTGDER